MARGDSIEMLTHTDLFEPLTLAFKMNRDVYSNYNWTTKFCSQRTSHMESSATSTTFTGPVGERLQAGTEDAPVLDRLVPLRRLHDSGAGYI